MTLDELKNELYGNMHDFATKLSEKELMKRQRNFLFPQDCAIPVNSVESFVLYELTCRN